MYSHAYSDYIYAYTHENIAIGTNPIHLYIHTYVCICVLKHTLVLYIYPH